VSMTKVSVLAKATGTATMTVYRHIQKLGVRLDGHLVKKGSSGKCVLALRVSALRGVFCKVAL